MRDSCHQMQYRQSQNQDLGFKTQRTAKFVCFTWMFEMFNSNNNKKNNFIKVITQGAEVSNLMLIPAK